MWWLCGACVSRVPRGLSLVIWGWGAEGGGQNLLLQNKKQQGLRLIHLPLSPPLSHRDTKSLKSLLPEVLLTGASSLKSSWHNNPVGTRAVEMHWPASGSTTYVTRKTKKACSFPSWKYLIWLHVIQTQSSLKVTLDSASVRFFLYLQTTFLSKPSKLSIFLHSEKPLSIAYGEKQTSKHTHTNALCTCNEGNTRKKKKKKKKKIGEEKHTHCLSNKILQSWKLQRWEGRVGFMLLYLARRSYTCTHTNTAEANTQTDVGGFFC